TIRYQGVNPVVGNAVALDGSVDLLLVVTVVAQGVKILRQSQMGQAIRNFFSGDAHAPGLDNRPHRRASATDNRLAAEDLIVTYHVWVPCCRGHFAPRESTTLAQRVAKLIYDLPSPDYLLPASDSCFSHPFLKSA